MRLRVSVAACLVAALLPSPSAAEWRRLDSPNFIVIGDAGEGDLRRVAVQFEGFRETLGRVLNAGVTATAVPTVIIVFRSDRAFTPYKPLYNGKPVAVGGVFYEGRDVNYITLLDDGRPGTLRTLFHEYAHLVVANVAMNLPPWLNEGLAEYYSTYEHARGGREAVIGRPVEPHLRLLNEKQLLPLDELLAVTRASSLYNEGNRRSVFYAQSWALTHMLLLGEPQRHNELAAYMRLVQQGATQADAWRQAFGQVNVAEELGRYLRQFSFRAYRFTFTDKLATFDAAAATPLPQADVAPFLADLYVRQRRFNDAEKLVDEALKADVPHLHAGIVKARIETERGVHDAASTRLAGLRPAADWFVSYLAGTSLADLIERMHDTNPERRASARAHLEAVGRVREVPNALAAIAMLEALSPERPSDAAQAAIARARALAPGRDQYALIHARVLAERGEFTTARGIIAPLMAPGYPDHIRNTARSWMVTVMQMEERQKRAAERAEQRAVDRPAGGTSVPEQADRPVQPLYRIGQPGEHRLEGTLEAIRCPASRPATFHLNVGGTVETFTGSLEQVEFITYRDDLRGTVSCGPLKPPMRVYLTWRAGKEPQSRVVVAVEFLPKPSVSPSDGFPTEATAFRESHRCKQL